MSNVTVRPSTAAEIATRLLEIEAIKLSSGNPFTWSSGWKSPVYCDNRLSLSYPPLRTYIKNELAGAIRENFPGTEYIAGVATAGIPQGALVADLLGLPFVYVRPKPKDHGMANLIEGRIEKGKRVAVVEDLISTGGSSLKAVQALRDAGLTVEGMVAIFTYGFDVAVNNFGQAGVRLVCLSDFEHLLSAAAAGKYLDEAQLAHVRSWRHDPAHWK